ncbi:MAG: sulfatase, partial [Planctomycetaceae bacterium]|nr:sulfatase [Planctomycetaceae bacterium]
MNVLFIAADDLRNDLGCYGHTQVRTPHLDALASRGVLFRKAYCQQAVCNPSRASLMTGRHPDTLRIWDLPTHFRSVAPDAVTLPQHFQHHGYFTQNIGKIYHNWIHEVQGDPASWSVPAVMHFANHGRDKAQVPEPLPPNLASDPKCECRDVPDEAYFDGRVARLAVKALQERKDAGSPFFLAVGFWKPHSPFNAPKRYWDLYSREDVSLPENPEWPKDAPRIAWHDSREILGKDHRHLTNDAIREIRHGYLANISYMDAQIGLVLNELRRLGLEDKTLVVFWSDHGWHLGEKDHWHKSTLWRQATRVPLILAGPGIAAGATCAEAVSLVDLYPTLNELCGFAPMAENDGESLAALLSDPAAARERPAVIEFDGRHAAVCDERYRYIRYGDGGEELY